MNAENRLRSLYGRRLDIRNFPDGKITVAFQNAEVKAGTFLVSEYGSGSTLQAACEDYMKRIRSKTLVFDAYASGRKEVIIL